MRNYPDPRPAHGAGIRRLAVVVSHPTQYYGPWFRHVAASPDIDLRVFYLWEKGGRSARDPGFGHAVSWDIDLLSGYSHEFVPNVSRDPGTHHFRGLKNPGLRQRLSAWSPDAVLVFGYAYQTQLDLLLHPPAPLIFRGDSHLIARARVPFLKRLVLRFVYSRCSAFACVGLANHDYFRAFGVPGPRLHFAPHCVDGRHFTRTPAIQAAADRLLDQLGLVGKKIVLFAGKFLRDKQPVALLEAFLALPAGDTAIVLVGDGPERPRLESLAASRPDRCIHILPFANQSEMPVRYALADVFVLPSSGLHETWGLAVNEAMHMGVPCLVSDRVGCQRDLVSAGQTGWVFPATSPDALRETLKTALDEVARDADGFRQRVLARVSGYTYEHAAAGLRAALDSACPDS